MISTCFDTNPTSRPNPIHTYDTDHIHQPPDLAHCLPHPHQPHHGAAHRNDGHRLPGPRGRGRTGRIGHRRRLLHGHLHGGLRLQHRHADTHRPPQRRGELPRDRRAVLPRHLFPDVPGRRDVPPQLLSVSTHSGAHHLLARRVPRRRGLPALARVRRVLLVQRGHLPRLLPGHGADQDPDAPS